MTTEAELIWYPGIYDGRTDGGYGQFVADISLDEIVKLVQKRATEDGEWAIANGFVGDNEDKMRRMMEFVSDRTNIQQCTAWIYKDGEEYDRTIDFVCRDLANASKMMVR